MIRQSLKINTVYLIKKTLWSVDTNMYRGNFVCPESSKIDAPLGVRFKNESPRIPALRHVMGESCNPAATTRANRAIVPSS